MLIKFDDIFVLKYVKLNEAIFPQFGNSFMTVFLYATYTKWLCIRGYSVHTHEGRKHHSERCNRRNMYYSRCTRVPPSSISPSYILMSQTVLLLLLVLYTAEDALHEYIISCTRGTRNDLKASVFLQHSFSTRASLLLKQNTTFCMLKTLYLHTSQLLILVQYISIQ